MFLSDIWQKSIIEIHDYSITVADVIEALATNQDVMRWLLSRTNYAGEHVEDQLAQIMIVAQFLWHDVQNDLTTDVPL